MGMHAHGQRGRITKASTACCPRCRTRATTIDTGFLKITEGRSG